MSGIAFVLSGCDFSAKNLGKVTFLEDANLAGISITGIDTVSGTSSQYSVGYTPLNTSQRGVTWSITSGGTYATIDANTGLLTVLSGANASVVTIKATSTVDNSIAAIKSITVTYVAAPILLTGLTINGSLSVNSITSQYTVGYTPSNTTQQGVAWSIVSGGTYATIDASTGLLTVLSGANASAVVIKATSIINNAISATKSITVTGTVTVLPTYQLPSPFQGNGSSTSYDTGIKLFDSVTKQWTIIASVSCPSLIVRSGGVTECSYFSCFIEIAPYSGLLYRYMQNAFAHGYLIYGNNKLASTSDNNASGSNNVIAISKSSDGIYTIYGNNYATVNPQVLTSVSSTAFNNTVRLGCEVNSSGAPFRFNNLIINDFKYFDSVLTDTQIKTLLSVYPVTLS